MISLKGRRPAVRVALATDSATDAASVLKKAKALKVPILASKDFPDHWGKYKHIFAAAQHQGKCAYCETIVQAGMSGDIEHFRPKAFCQGLQSPKNKDDTGGQSPKRKTMHKEPGYWWLAYDWSNYLYSCSRCNSTWKKNQFPILGNRAAQGGKLDSEGALLLNPFDDDPESHLEFDPNTGQVRGLSARGRATIDVCGLDRKSLEMRRATKGAKLLHRRDEYLVALSKGNDAAVRNSLRAILDECRDAEPYAGLARDFVKRQIGLKYGDLLKLEMLGNLAIA